MDEHTREHAHESPAVVTVPLVLLAIPSVISGFLIDPVVFGNYFEGAIQVLPGHEALDHVGAHFHGTWQMMVHGVQAAPFWLAMGGLVTAAVVYLGKPQIAEWLKRRFALIHRILERKYGCDEFNEVVFAGGGRGIGRLFWRIGDARLIDGLIVNGSAKAIGWFAGTARYIQSGYLYHYAFAMIVGLLGLLSWFVLRSIAG